MPAAILSYCSQYPPEEWEKIQDLRGEDSEHELWWEMTDRYHDQLTIASEKFAHWLATDPITEATAEDFCLDPTNFATDTIDAWRGAKEVARGKSLASIIEEDEETAITNASPLAASKDADTDPTEGDRRASITTITTLSASSCPLADSDEPDTDPTEGDCRASITTITTITTLCASSCPLADSNEPDTDPIQGDRRASTTTLIDHSNTTTLGDTTSPLASSNELDTDPEKGNRRAPSPPLHLSRRRRLSHLKGRIKFFVKRLICLS